MGKKIINTNSSNSNVITNSNGNRNIHQIQNNNSKRENKESESTDFYFNELMASMRQLTQEVKELKEQLKNKNS